MNSGPARGLILGDRQIQIQYKDRRVFSRCRITFDLTRDHHLEIECLESLHELVVEVFPPYEPFFLELWPGTEQIKCHAKITRSVGSFGETVFMIFLPTSRVGIDRGTPLVRVDAGLLNMYKYFADKPMGAKTAVENSQSVLSLLGPKYTSLELTDGRWLFQLIPVGESTLQYSQNIQNESHIFTHHLVLTRIDTTQFSTSDAQAALHMLSTYLSFCAEHWISPALVVGHSGSGVVTMEDWGIRFLDPPYEPDNGLDEYNGSAIEECFPGFCRRWEEASWHDAIRTAIYWYVRSDAERVGTDGSIILVQAALERLAWHILVRHRHAISESGFSDLSASDKIRLMLNECDLPLEVPAQLTRLTAAAKDRNWDDGPHAFVEVRNQIVHPPRRRKTPKPLDSVVYFQVLQLGKWYLELILLRQFGFTGKYSNRLRIPRWRGELEYVPWSGGAS